MTETEAAKQRDRDVLWQALDWTFWGVGMGDVFREPLADKMIAALSAEEFEKAQVLIRQWNDYRGGPHERNLFEELKAERDAVTERAERAEAAIERVRALHYPLLNSASAMYPEPLCACDSGGYGECQTAAAMEPGETKTAG